MHMRSHDGGNPFDLPASLWLMPTSTVWERSLRPFELADGEPAALSGQDDAFVSACIQFSMPNVHHL
jgi:hypothetical protein